MIIKTLENTSIEDLLKAFNKSFENYFIPLILTVEQLEYKIKVDNIQLDISVGMFDKDELVGFILHGLDASKKCVYNGGTGVIEAYRGQGITRQLYKYIIPKVQHRGITHSKLEVIKENIPAKKIYEHVGYNVLRKVSCMVTSKRISAHNAIEVHQIKGNELNPELMEDDMIPTWQSSMQSIQFQKDDLVQYVVKENEEIIGNLVLNSISNRILRLNVKKDKRRQGVGNALLSHASNKNPQLSVLNLDSTNVEVIGFFESKGFEVLIQQYEMLNKF